jgi:hypothetical protein
VQNWKDGWVFYRFIAPKTSYGTAMGVEDTENTASFLWNYLRLINRFDSI